MLRPATNCVIVDASALAAGEGRSAMPHLLFMLQSKGERMAHRLLKIAACYFVLAVCLGAYMGATENFEQVAVHTHLNLLGWVSLAIIGCLYLLKPALATTRLATAHFWLHNIGAPSMLVGVALIHGGNEAVGGPIAGIFSIVTVIGIICFAVNLWQGLDRA
jgi:hypothetical protein